MKTRLLTRVFAGIQITLLDVEMLDWVTALLSAPDVCDDALTGACVRRS